MKFYKAIQLLEEGKKIIRKGYKVDIILNSYKDVATLFHRSSENEIFLNMICDWELYEEPQKYLSFNKILEGLKRGRIYTRKEWQKDHLRSFVKIFTSLYFPMVILNEHEERAMLTIEDFEATDWIEISEPRGCNETSSN